MSRSAEGGAPGDLWFDGEVHADAAQRDRLNLGLARAACQGDAPCELDQQMMLGCLGGQSCTESRLAYLRARYGAMSDAEFDQGLLLAERIRHAVSSADVRAFVR